MSPKATVGLKVTKIQVVTSVGLQTSTSASLQVSDWMTG